MPAAAIVAAVAAVLVGAVVGLRKVFVQALPEWLRIVRDVDDTTEIDRATGAVRSVQSAEVVLPAERIDTMWAPQYLERLARTYWRFLTRATLGIIRVYYTEGERYVCLLFRPLKLLTFQAPEYEMDDRRGVVRWRIERGLLVARRGRGGDGYLEIDVERRPSEQPGFVNVAIEVAVANFYPAVASRLSRFVYTNTQSRIHVIVTHGFLRSLARLDFEESRVGRFVTADEVPDPSTPPPSERNDTTPGFVTLARARRSWFMVSRTVVLPLLAAALLGTAATAASADTLVTAAPGARNLAANGGYQAWASPAAGGRWRLTVRAPDGVGEHAGHRGLRRAAAPADRLDPVRRLGPAPAGRLLALPGRLGHRRVRRLRLRPGARAPSRRSPSCASKTYSETAPSIELGRLAFVRRGGGPKPGVYYWARGSSKAPRSGSRARSRARPPPTAPASPTRTTRAAAAAWRCGCCPATAASSSRSRACPSSRAARC